MSAAARKFRILLVEDNAADVQLLRMAFQEASLDCDLIVLEDGAEALALVRQQGRFAESQVPDLAVLDLNLPKNGGVEVLDAIRESQAFRQMPVAILSSSSSPRERAKIEEFGVKRFLTKPLDLDEFLGLGLVLKTLLEDCNPGSIT